MNLATVISVKKESTELLSTAVLGLLNKPNLNGNVHLAMPRGNGKSLFTLSLIEKAAERGILVWGNRL